MRRARFYILVLGLTLLPQVVAASDLVRWLASQGQVVLGLSVPGLLLALNLPMMAEILRRKKQARLPRFVAATLQAPWTAWWLGRLFCAVLRAGWTVAHLGHAPMPIPLAAAPFALSLYGTLFGARVLRREKVTIPVAGLPEGWRGARIVQLSDLHAGRHVTKERLRAIARRAARLNPDLLVVTGDIVHNSPQFARRAAEVGVELQLAGHTHGGRVALLWLHRPLSLARLITPFVAGLYRAGRSYLYVNRGAGSVMPMVRLGARPEVTELTLVPATDSEAHDDLAIAAS